MRVEFRCFANLLVSSHTFIFQNEKVNSVRDALACLVSKEPLTGYVCSKTGQVVEASRQTTLEELPPVLILHLKCFVYDKSGGCQKLLKRVEFSSDLELSKGISFLRFIAYT